MQFIHHIFFKSTADRKKELAALGMIIGDGYITFDVAEDEARWPRIEGWMKAEGISDFVFTKFSQDEIERSSWLGLVAEWHYGYPQPDEENFGFLQTTYDLTESCKKCRIPLKQKTPFQIRGEPKWGRRSIFQLNWVFDEFFVKPEIWSGIFEPYGVRCRPVLNKRGHELCTVVQLVTDAPEVDFDDTGLKFEQCDACERKKYLPNYSGCFPRLLEEPLGSIVKTKKYFGSGAQAFKGVLVSQDLARKLISAKILGVSFKPVAEGKIGGQV